MKQIMLILGSLIVLTCFCNDVGPRAGQPKIAKTTVPGQTKIAFVNIGLVIEKTQPEEFETEVRKAIEPFMQKAKELTEEIGKWKKEFLALPNVSPADKERYQQKLVKNKIEMEALDQQVRKTISKISDEQVRILYKQANQAIQEYAKANGFHAVLAYGNIQQDNASAISVRIKGMEAGGIAPLYIAPELEISSAIIETINAKKRK